MRRRAPRASSGRNARAVPLCPLAANGPRRGRRQVQPACHRGGRRGGQSVRSWPRRASRPQQLAVWAQNGPRSAFCEGIAHRRRASRVRRVVGQQYTMLLRRECHQTHEFVGPHRDLREFCAIGQVRGHVGRDAACAGVTRMLCAAGGIFWLVSGTSRAERKAPCMCAAPRGKAAMRRVLGCCDGHPRAAGAASADRQSGAAAAERAPTDVCFVGKSHAKISSTLATCK